MGTGKSHPSGNPVIYWHFIRLRFKHCLGLLCYVIGLARETRPLLTWLNPCKSNAGASLPCNGLAFHPEEGIHVAIHVLLVIPCY